MKGFPTKTPLKAFVEVKFEDGSDEISRFPHNHIKNFSIEIGGTGKVELELYDADGIISQEVIAATNKGGGRFATGKKIFVRWGWNENGKEISSKEHKVQILKVRTKWEPATGFVYTLEGVPFNVEKRNLKGSYSGKPHEAIQALLKEAFGGKETIKVTYIQGDQESSGSDFFTNEKVTAEGENNNWEVVLRKILAKCEIASKEQIFYHRSTITNELVISDHSKNKKNINDDFFDGKSFEFGRLPSGSNTYLMEFDTELDNTLLALSKGVQSQNITEEFTSDEESDTANENVGVSGDKNIGKTGDAKGGGIEDNQGKLGSSEVEGEPGGVEAQSTVELSKATSQPDDEDLEGRTPQDLSTTQTTQFQRAFNQIASKVEATFIGNPMWDDSKYMAGAKLNFDVYSAKAGKTGQNLNKILSIVTEAQMVIHTIQGGQYTCTFPNLTTQPTS